MYASDVKEILREGGGMVVDATEWYTSTLKEFAKAAREGGGNLQIKNYGDLFISDMKGISRNGKGHVIFM